MMKEIFKLLAWTNNTHMISLDNITFTYLRVLFESGMKMFGNEIAVLLSKLKTFLYVELLFCILCSYFYRTFFYNFYKNLS